MSIEWKCLHLEKQACSTGLVLAVDVALDVFVTHALPSNAIPSSNGPLTNEPHSVVLATNVSMATVIFVVVIHGLRHLPQAVSDDDGGNGECIESADNDEESTVLLSELSE